MAKSVLVVDNYDSFTFNLVQCLEALGAKCRVALNDQLDLGSLAAAPPDGVLVSPGPGNPEQAGVSLELVREWAGKIPIFGVCLGHQVIAQVFGARIERAERPTHGKTSPVLHDGQGLFEGLPRPFLATRYHSLRVAAGDLPEALEITATTPEGEIMGLRHRALPVEGVQFHPESILTEHGPQLVQNWLLSL